jgi:hypothetical protein
MLNLEPRTRATRSNAPHQNKKINSLRYKSLRLVRDPSVVGIVPVNRFSPDFKEERK